MAVSSKGSPKLFIGIAGQFLLQVQKLLFADGLLQASNGRLCPKKSPDFQNSFQ